MGRRRRPARKGRGRAMRPRSRKYSGVKLYKETKEGVPIIMPVGGGGIQNYRAKLTASLLDITNSIPNGATTSTYAAYRSLYERYAIVGVKYRFIPTNTSSDSGTRAADRVVYAPNRGTLTVVGSEDDIIRQDDCKFTNTNREFSIYVKYPKPVLFTQVGQGNMNQSDIPAAVPGAGANANIQAPSQKGLVWLSTRVNTFADASGNLTSAAHPDHCAADLHITSNNKTLTEPYQVYTMYKTVYFAFTNQD